VDVFKLLIYVKIKCKQHRNRCFFLKKFKKKAAGIRLLIEEGYNPLNEEGLKEVGNAPSLE
jgi:hypothetical protein